MENSEQEKSGSRWSWSDQSQRFQLYVIYCGIVLGLVFLGNRLGYFPTYGLWSGENSLHSSSRHGYYGGYGIHGK